MTNPSKRDSAAKKVLAVARSIVTYEIGLPPGCVRMNRSLSWLKPYETGLPTVFEEYLREVQGLPITSERLQWDRSLLREKDKVLETTNQRFRVAFSRRAGPSSTDLPRTALRVSMS